jgi:uncharacterized linocin/CFP29 family protein
VYCLDHQAVGGVKPVATIMLDPDTKQLMVRIKHDVGLPMFKRVAVVQVNDVVQGVGLLQEGVVVVGECSGFHHQ